MILVRFISYSLIFGLFLTPIGLLGKEDKLFYGKQLLEEGEALEYFFKYEEALPLFEQAADCFSEIDSFRLESYALSSIGNMQIELGAYKLAKAPFENALLLAEKADHPLEKIIAREGLAKLLYFDGDAINSIAAFRELIPAREALLGPYDIELGIINNFVGSIYGNRGDYELAAAHFTEGLEVRIHNLGPESKLLASSYYNLGTSFSIQGDFNQALEFFTKSLYLVKKHQGEENLHLFSIYNGLGAAYLGLGELDKAKTYLTKADDIAKKKLGADNLRRQFVLMNFAMLARARSDLDSTMLFLNERLALQQKHLPPAHHTTILTLSKMGWIYANNQFPEKGLAFLEQAEELIEIDQEGRANDEKSTVYFNLGYLHLSQERHQLALEYFQKGLQDLSWGPALDQNFAENPSLDNIIDWPLVLRLLYSKALSLYALSDYDPHHPYHQLATETLLHAANLIDLIRIRLKTASAQESLSQRGKAIYQAIIELAYERYQLEEDREALELAFWAAEKNKAFLLLRNKQMSEIDRKRLLPEKLRNFEAELKSDISYYESQLYEHREEEQTDSFRERQNQLFTKRQTYDSLTKVLEKQYPEYFQAQYPTKRIKVEEIQAHLQNSPQTTWLEYVWGDSSLFAFVINAEQSHFVAIEATDSLAMKIKAIGYGLNHGLEVSNKSDVSNFAQNSHAIYQQILAPLKPYFALQTTQLIIVPDRKLFQLPFELLLAELPPEQTSFKKLPYLLHDFDIQYDASASIWDLQMQRSTQSHNKQSLILAHGTKAQTVSKTNYVLDTEAEAQTIKQMVGGVLYSGQEASKALFKQLAPQYGLLHLACHAQLDDINPQFSALFLADTTNGDGRLSIQELSQSKLNAELAVLSACETGKGKYLDGEGQISLTYGFLTAGVPAVVMSLWQVEDQSTQKLMQYFYQNLSQGMPKDQALRQAKIEYLRLADPFTAHPRFWAAFVAQGNMKPLGFLQNKALLPQMLNSLSFWLVLGAILGILAIYLGKRLRNAKFSGISK